MGLTSWKNAPDGKIVKTDVTIAKNYLAKEEITELNEILYLIFDYPHKHYTFKYFEV